MRTRAILTTAAMALAAGGAFAALPASAAGGGGCTLDGTATFVNGPNGTDHPFTYTFSGTLANCMDSAQSGVSGGTIGTLVPATGSGTCANGTTAGYALVTWADKTTSVIQYTTTSAAAGVVLQGNVIDSYTVTQKVGKKKKKVTYTSTRYKGDGAVGTLIFQADPMQCQGTGVTTAPIKGFTGIGSQN